MSQVSSLAKALGKDITLPGTSAKDAAEAMTELAKGGLSVGQSMSAVRGVLQLSAAAQIDNASAATITARALNAFGLAGNQATRVADLLAAGSNATTAEITDLAAGMQMASASFVMAGQPIDTLVTSLGLLANNGIAGSDAGTSLKTMMLRLAAPTGEAATKMKAMGVSVFDAQGQMRPMRDLIGQYTAATKGMSQESRIAALSTIFGADASRAAFFALSAGVGAYDKLHAAVTRHGAAADLAAAKTKGFNGALEAFKSNAETLAITLGTPLLGAATTAMSGLSGLVDFIGKIAAAPTLSLKFDVAWEGITSVWDRIKSFFFGQTVHIPKLEFGGGADIQTSGLIGKLQAQLDAVDWSAVGASVGRKIVAGIVAGSADLDAIARKLTDKINSIDWHAAGASVGKKISDAIRGSFSGGGGGGAEGAGPALAKALLGGLWAAFKGIMDGVTAGIRTRLHEWSAQFQAWATGLPGRFVGWLAGLPGRVTSAIAGVAGAIAAKVAGWGAQFQAWATGLPGRVAGWLAGLPGRVAGAIAAGAEAITSKVASWGTAAHQLGARVLSGVKSGIGDLYGAVVDKLSAAWDALKSAAGQAAGLAKAIGVAIYRGVISGIGDLYGAVKGKIEGALSALKSIDIPGASPPEHAAAEAIGKPLARGVIGGFLAGTVDLPQKISDRLRNSLEAGKRAVETMRGTFSSAFDRLAGDALKAFDARTEAMISKITARFDRARADLEARHDAASSRVAGGLASREGRIDARAEAPTRSEAALARIRAIHDEAAAARELADAQRALNEARAGSDPAAIASAEQRLAEVLYTQQVAGLEKRAALERQARDAKAADEKQRAEDTAAATQARLDADEAKKKAKLDAAEAGEKLNVQARRDRLRRDLEDQLAVLEQVLSQHPGKYQKVHNQIMGMFSGEFGPGFRTAGANLGNAFAAGLDDSFDTVEKSARALAGLVAKYMKLKSPAEAGPLSSLDSWWAPFAPTLLSGLDTAAIGAGVSGAVSPSVPAAALGLNGAYATPTGGAGGDVYNVNVTVEGSVASERELAYAVHGHLLRLGKRNVSVGLA